jgi:hypothetical protein
MSRLGANRLELVAVIINPGHIEGKLGSTGEVVVLPPLRRRIVGGIRAWEK